MIDSKEKNFVSAVVYVRNNEMEIANFIKEINTVLKNNFLKYELVFVNDASTDNSVNIIKDSSKLFDSSVTSIVNMSYYQGLEIAMNAGVDIAIGDFVFEFDTTAIDFQTELVMKIYKKSLEGFDIVSAAPRKINKLSSNLFYKIFNRYSHVPNKLFTETFRILSRRVINRIQSISKTIPYRKAIYAECGLKTTTVFYDRMANVVEEHKDSNRMNLAIDAIVLFTDVAYRLAITFTVTMMGISLVTVFYALAMFFDRKPIEGWTSMVLLIALGLFGLFAVLSIIIKYLSVILNLIFRKQEYVVESVIKLTK